MEKDKRVFVYEDPVSCLRLEGVATLVKKISSDHWSERWLVRFDNGDEVERTINKGDDKCIKRIPGDLERDIEFDRRHGRLHRQ